MRKVYLHRENIVESNTYWPHDNDIFNNRRCDEECNALEDHTNYERQPREKKYKKPISINNSWNRNARQYRTKAAGAISQINFDQVIAVWSEAFCERVREPPKQFVPKEPPVHLDYKYAVVDRLTHVRSRTTKSLYRRKSNKLTNTNLSRAQK